MAETASADGGDAPEPMWFDLSHRGAGQFSWWSARCQTCGKVKRGSLPFTAERAILKHAVKEHGGLVYADGRLYEISFTTTRARDRRPREDVDRPDDEPVSGP